MWISEKLENLIRDALEGFKSVLLYGDEELEMEAMEPYLIEDELPWYYEGEEEEHK